MLRECRADNPSAMTLDGTRTYIVGERRCAIIDPGPDEPSHINTIAGMTGSGAVVAILLTHEHSDHAGAADSIAERLAVPILGVGRGSLQDGQVIETDAGDVITVHTPGHTPDHACFFWQPAGAVFCGDLMMGGLDTALVAPPEGDLHQYLASLERLAELDAAIIHPAHGPSFDEPAEAIGRYVRHREERQAQVMTALGSGAKTERQITASVYGESLPPGLEEGAVSAIRAYLDYLQRLGSVTHDRDGWKRVDG